MSFRLPRCSNMRHIFVCIQHGVQSCHGIKPLQRCQMMHLQAQFPLKLRKNHLKYHYLFLITPQDQHCLLALFLDR